MECTGHYYEPVARELSQAGFFVSAVNPQIIRNFQGQDNPLRKVKTDKADSVKIARYTLDSWANLKQYSLMDELRSRLKTMNRQFDFYMKHKTAMKNNLIGLIDQTYPGANTYFDSPAREDGSRNGWISLTLTGMWIASARVPKRFYRPLSEVVQPQEIQLQQVKSWKKSMGKQRNSFPYFQRTALPNASSNRQSTN